MGEWIVDIRLIADWLGRQDEETERLVIAAIEQLSRYGPNLRRPLVGAINGSRYRNMKELRPASSGRSEVRILFAFDPDRHAILLPAGDKANAGRLRNALTWNAWYRKAIPEADRRFAEHLERLHEGETR